VETHFTGGIGALADADGWVEGLSLGKKNKINKLQLEVSICGHCCAHQDCLTPAFTSRAIRRDD